ncbi:hypothetical protein EJB05_14721, partial [Eragrostis curvula]
MDCPNRSAVAGLPDDALADILSRLPAKFLCRSKCVSKPWRDLIADRLRCKKLPQTLAGFLYGSLETEDSDSGEDWSTDDCYSAEGQHYISDDINGSSDEDGHNCRAEDGNGSGSSNKNLTSDINGHFIDNCSGEVSHNCRGEDGDGSGSSDKNLTSDTHGHFIDLLGRPAPLVDPSFSFLRKMSGIGSITLLDSCGGLVLLGNHRDSDMTSTPGYVVCNPATEHLVLVPSSRFVWISMEELLFNSDDDDEGPCVATYLIFDPAISLHFQLIEFCHTPKKAVVNTYSSETASWTDWSGQLKQWKRRGKWNMFRTISSMRDSMVFNKMLHLIVSPRKGPELIAAIDGEGKTCKIIPLLENREWNMKHTVSFSELFGKVTCKFGSDYNVVSIHPEHNLVFFVQHWDYKLISYDMDRKEVCHLCTVGCDYERVTPYFPYFLESPAWCHVPASRAPAAVIGSKAVD